MATSFSEGNQGQQIERNYGHITINQTRNDTDISENKICQENRRESLLNSFDFDEMHTRRLEIDPAGCETCQWLPHHPDYRAWLDPKRLSEHHGFLCISGKPGAGKSTIMNFAQQTLSQTFSECNRTTVASYFFHARGRHLQKSVIGLYRSLLHQLLTEIPDLQAILDDRSLLPRDRVEGCPPLNILKQLFSRAVLRLGQKSFVCFIDALDECDDNDIAEVVEYFEELAQNSITQNIEFRVCFSSRHYPHISISHGIRLILENQTGHTRDMEAFVSNHLKIKDRKLFCELKSKLLEKASGVFLWIKLVVGILNKEYRHGGLRLKRRLEEIPSRLSDLLKEILHRDSEDPEDFLLCIIFILYAKRPLTPEEFYHALWSGLAMKNQGLVDDGLPDLQPSAVEYTLLGEPNKVELYVVSSSKGLAEITGVGQRRVQFIHESVRDYLVKDKGLEQLLPGWQSTQATIVHQTLKECCIHYINCVKAHMQDGELQLLRREILEAEYAQPNSSRPTNSVTESQLILPQFAFWARKRNASEISSSAKSLNPYDKPRQIPFNNAAFPTQEADQSFHPTSSIEPQICLYEFELSHIRKAGRALVDQPPAFFNINYSQCFPTSSNESPIRKYQGSRLIHDPGTWPAQADRDLLKPSFILNKFQAHNPPLPIHGGSLDVPFIREADLPHLPTNIPVPTLIRRKYSFLDYATMFILFHAEDAAKEYPQDKFLESFPLNYWIHMTNLFQHYPTDLAEDVWTDPTMDKIEHQVEMVYSWLINSQILTSAQRQLLRPVRLGDSLLYTLANNGLSELIRTSRRSGFDANDYAQHRRYPLFVALLHGERNTLAALLNLPSCIYKGIDILDGLECDLTWIGDSDQTPLSWAAGRGKYEIVEALLLDGAMDWKLENGQTALSQASENGHEKVVRILLEHGSDVEQGFPLEKASKNDHEAIVKLLLDRGADIDNGNSLASASRNGRIAIAQLLIEKGADVNHQDHSGHPPLFYASGSIVKLLLEHGADTEKQGVAIGDARSSSHPPLNSVEERLLGIGTHFGTIL